MEAMRLMKEHEEIKAEVAAKKCYHTGRERKDGSADLGLAFYYHDLNGKKKRKNLTGGSSEELHKRAAEFLDEQYKLKQDALKCIQEAMKQTELEELVKRSTGIQPCDKTICEVMDMYLDSYLPSVGYSQANTQKYYRDIVNKRIGDEKFVEFTFDKFQNLLNDLLYMDDGVTYRAEKSIQEIRKFLTKVLEYGWKMKWISRDDFQRFTSGLKCPEGAAEYDKNEKFYTCEEVGKILYCLKDNKRYWILTQIAVLTGLRGQELFALEKKDLVRDEHYINVRQALVGCDKEKTGRAFEVGKTKTKSSVRRVPATDTVFQLFDELELILQRSAGKRRKSPRELACDKGNGSYVFVDTNGNIVDKKSLNHNWEIALKNGSKKYFSDGQRWSDATIHCFRHCYITYLSNMAADFRMVQKAVGHSMGNNVTDRYYNSDNSSHIEYLLPYVEKIARDIETGYQAANEEAIKVMSKNVLPLW